MKRPKWDNEYRVLRASGIVKGSFTRLLLFVYSEFHSQGTDTELLVSAEKTLTFGPRKIRLSRVFSWAEDCRVAMGERQLVEALSNIPCLTVDDEFLIFDDQGCGVKDTATFWAVLGGIVAPETSQDDKVRGTLSELVELVRMSVKWTMEIVRFCRGTGKIASPVFWKKLQPVSEAPGSFCTSTLGVIANIVDVIPAQLIAVDTSEIREYVQDFGAKVVIEDGPMRGGVALPPQYDDDYPGANSNEKYYSGTITCPNVNSTAQLLRALAGSSSQALPRLAEFLITQRLPSGLWPIFRFDDEKLCEPRVLSTALVFLAAKELESSEADLLASPTIERFLAEVGEAKKQCSEILGRTCLVDQVFEPADESDMQSIDATALLLLSLLDEGRQFEDCYDQWFDVASKYWPEESLSQAPFRVRVPAWEDFDSGYFQWEFSRKGLWSLTIAKKLRYATPGSLYSEDEWQLVEDGLASNFDTQVDGQWFDIPMISEGKPNAMAQNCWLGVELIATYLAAQKNLFNT